MKTDDDLIREALLPEDTNGFEPGFADRALARWRMEREGSLAEIMGRQVRRWVPMAAAAALLLSLFSVLQRDRTAGQSLGEALLGWKSAEQTAATAPTIESLYGLYALNPSR